MTGTCSKLVVTKKYTLLLRSYCDGINYRKATSMYLQYKNLCTYVVHNRNGKITHTH